jgi:beta-glucosidase
MTRFTEEIAVQEPYRQKDLPINTRVEDLLSRMTLKEKIAQTDMIRGVELATKVHPKHFCAVDESSDFHWDRVEEAIGSDGMGFVHDVYSVPKVLNRLQRWFVEKTRLGIPCIFTGEALHGLSYPGATVFPMPLNLGASFDRSLTYSVGHAIAAETRSLNIHEILAPNLDVARDPRWGRMEETFGEDTYLSSEMAYQIITGEQGRDIKDPDTVVCEPKHYCVHGIPEGGVNCGPARAGVREVELSYLPVFEAGIKKAGAYNAMASYNSIDGEAVMASEHYLREVLQERFGLKGYVRSDFGGINRLKTNHCLTKDDLGSMEMALKAGVHVQGFDYPNAVWQAGLLQLVKAGRISEDIINDAARRVLRVKFELGLFENPYASETHYKNVIRCEEHRALCYKAACESTVLLKNHDHLLPLDKKTGTLALIGPSSRRQRIGSYASVPDGYKVRSLYEELQEAMPGWRILQEDGCAISDRDVTLMPAGWLKNGVKLTYFADGDFSQKPVGQDVMGEVNFNWILAKPHRELRFLGYGVRMEGEFEIVPEAVGREGSFAGQLVFTTEDSVRLYVDDKLVIDSFGNYKQPLPACEFYFDEGKQHHFVAEYVCDVSGNRVTLSLMPSGRDSIDKAVALAQMADVTVLVCGDDTVTSGEGMDRCELTLYGRQKELVKRVADTGKPAVLVLEVGKPVELGTAGEALDAVVVPWFGGEMGAKAIADVLTGKVNPAGRLPVSFPRSVGTLPCYYSNLPGASAEYLEGKRDAIYPFGHGLSYTEFTYHDLCLEKTGAPYGVRVSLTVMNAGKRAGDEVVQLYVRDEESSIVSPSKLLKGFERISLAPGDAKTVTFDLGFDAFKLMNKRYEWVVEPGEFSIMAGASSEDIRLEGKVIL